MTSKAPRLYIFYVDVDDDSSPEFDPLGTALESVEPNNKENCCRKRTGNKSMKNKSALSFYLNSLENCVLLLYWPTLPYFGKILISGIILKFSLFEAKILDHRQV